MYRWLRNTHLLVGLICAPFLLMYGLSAVQIAYIPLDDSKRPAAETSVVIPADVPDEGRAIARELMDNHGLRGEVRQIQKTDAGLNLRIVRVGASHEVEYVSATRLAKIRSRTRSLLGMLNGLHHAAGLWHDYGVLNFWGVCVGLTSAGLILMIPTGIYLWLKLRSLRTIGAILMVAGLSASALMLVLIRTG